MRSDGRRLLQLGRAFASQLLATSEIGTYESGTLMDAERDHPYFKDNRGAPSNMVATAELEHLREALMVELAPRGPLKENIAAATGDYLHI